MVRRIVLTLLVVASLIPTARSEMIPTVAMPVGWNPLQHAEIADCLANLLAYSRFGAGDEHAAFVVLRDDGRFACVPWRDNRATPHGVRFKGVVPQGTVAVAHTHPAGQADPSRQDRLEADRFDVPFIVVSLGMITMARPGGEAVVTLEDRFHTRTTAMASSELSRSRSSALSRR
jgi:hypothetical protein